MKQGKNRQPAFALEANSYREEALQGIADCFCYEFTLSRDAILIPNNSMEWLWNVNQQRFFCFPYIERHAWFLAAGDHFFGIHVNPVYQCEWEDGRAQMWVRQAGRLSSLEARSAYCGEQMVKAQYLRKRHPLICHAIRQIEESEGRAVVEEIAADFDYSKRHLQRLFLQNFLYSPKRFCQYVRLQNAVSHMIQSPEAAVSSWVEALGYSDPSHFQREFKRYIGMTPKQFIKWYWNEY